MIEFMIKISVSTLPVMPCPMYKKKKKIDYYFDYIRTRRSNTRIVRNPILYYLNPDSGLMAGDHQHDGYE